MKSSFLSLLLLVCPWGAYAQSVNGSGVVGGRVLDNFGEGLPDAEVVIGNPGMGVSRTVRTSMDGIFQITGLAPATGYRLQATHKKFLDWQGGEFEVFAGRRVSFDVPMRTRDGASDAPVSADSNPSPIGTVMDARRMEMLPVFNLNWRSLSGLAPAPYAAAQSTFVDGVFVSAARVPQDAVAGFEVLSAAAPVEFAHGFGAATNVVTRSGSSGLHGAIYDYFGNHTLDALDRNALGRNLSGHRHKPGFNLGGALPGQKLFFFTSVEVGDEHAWNLNRITSPLLTGKNYCTATTAQCAALARVVDAQQGVLTPRSKHDISGAGKIDYRRSERNVLTLAAWAAHSRSPFAADGVSMNGGALGGATTKTDTHAGRIEWLTAPALTATNELRLSLFHDRVANSASSTRLATGARSVDVAGMQLGEAHPDAAWMRERRFQLADHVRATAGSHTLLVGIDWLKTHDKINGLVDGSGAYHYATAAALAQDLAPGGTYKNYSLFTQTFGDPYRNIGHSEIGFYAQDTWRATRRLQVTGGIRWSKPYLPDLSDSLSSYYQTSYFNSPNVNADPRIAAAYMVDQHTVVRVGYGMYHAPHTSALVDALYTNTGAYQASTLMMPGQASSPLFPAALPVQTLPSGIIEVMYAATKLRNPYTKQITIGVERNVGAGFTVSANYIGNRGVKLWTADDQNLSSTTKAVTYTINDAAGLKTGTYSTPLYTSRGDARYAHVYQIGNGGSSWYRALTLQARRRAWHGMSVDAAYTWSHAIDDVGGTLTVAGVPVSSVPGDRVSDRGSSAFDQRHRATIDWTWQSKLSKSDGAVARYLVNGWELSSIATLASSQPMTALVAVSPGQQFSKIDMAFAGTLNGSGGWARVPFLPVGSLDAGAGYTVNARLARPIPIAGRLSARLSLEAFNLFNTQYSTSVNTLAYTATGGVLTPVANVGAGSAASNARSCQAALRFSF